MSPINTPIEAEICETTSEALSSDAANRVFQILAGNKEIELHEFMSRDINEYTIEELKFICDFFLKRELSRDYSKILERLKINENKPGTLKKLIDNTIGIDHITQHYSEKIREVFMRLLDEGMGNQYVLGYGTDEVTMTFDFKVEVLKSVSVPNKVVIGVVPESGIARKYNTKVVGCKLLCSDGSEDLGLLFNGEWISLDLSSHLPGMKNINITQVDSDKGNTIIWVDISCKNSDGVLKKENSVGFEFSPDEKRFIWSPPRDPSKTMLKVPDSF